ncbi:MAG TPA: YceI family protein [Burkholderiales bacterium]|nr:YceI family protein [Burkholderiales bacterium]
MMRWLILAVAAGLPVVTAATEQNVVYDKSRITCASRQMGVPVEADFRQFTARIDFDPGRPDGSRISIAINTASFEFDPEVDDEVRGRLWLNAHDFPQARFISSSVRAIGNGRYEARGTLEIKGARSEVTVPFTYQPAAGGVFEGVFVISRLHYNIGEGKWRDTDTVGDDVQIKFRIVTDSPAAKRK